MEERYTETFQSWNKIALLYQEKFMDLDLYNDSYDFICKSIALEHPNLLEIGCGPGNITKYLLSQRPDFIIHGIDISAAMIALAKKNNPGASFRVMDCRQIDGIKTQYDGIICGFCLPYLSQEDSPKFILDCYKLLYEKGLLYISFVEGDPEKSGYQISSNGERTYFYYYYEDEIVDLLQKNNFNSIQVLKKGYLKANGESETHVLLTAIKN